MHKSGLSTYLKVTTIWSRQVEPFYMTFPMQNLYQAEMEYEKDLERMKEMYPKDVARIAAYISERCDELEFEGSRIYDENPDRFMMEKEAQALYEKVRKELGLGENVAAASAEPVMESASQEQPEDERVEAFSLTPPAEWAELEKADVGLETASPRGSGGFMPPPPPPGPGGFMPPPPPPGPGGFMPPPQNGCNDWLCGMVGVLFQDEIYRRRCRYRRCRRWW